MTGFNLVDDSWIPCIKKGGQYCECSLREALFQAGDIIEIYDPSPLVTIALHRLLLAILHRNFGPEDLTEWRKLWNQGHWDQRKLDEYFHKRYQRFNLFDRERPFYQQAELDGSSDEDTVARIILEKASGNNATLFDHNYRVRPNVWSLKVSAAVAARHLVAFQAFAVGGGVSKPFNFCDAPLTRDLVFLVIGNDLFQTLMLNMVIYNAFKPIRHLGKDLPCWEQDTQAEPDKNGTLPSGYLDYLTWQSRAVRLFRDNDGRVSCCRVRQNLRLKEDSQTVSDPFKAYKRDKARGWQPLRLGKNRAVWRDSHTFLQSAKPEILHHLSQVGGQVGGTYRLSVVGLVLSQANPVLWRHERLPLPVRYLCDDNLLEALKQLLDIAEKAARILREGLELLASRLIEESKKKTGDTSNLVEHLSPEAHYWSRLGSLFPRLMQRLAEDPTPDGERYGERTKPWWAEEVREAAWQAFHSVIYSLGSSGNVLKAATVSASCFEKKLHSVTNVRVQRR